jgi:hypothetical protein
MRQLEEEEMQQFVLVARQVWFRRNKFVFEDEFDSPLTVNRIAYEQLEMFKVRSRKSANKEYDTNGC